MDLTEAETVSMGVLFAIIFGIIFYLIAPFLGRQGSKMANNIGNDLKGVAGSDLLAGTAGLVIGLVVAFLLTKIYQGVVSNVMYLTLTIGIYMVFGFMGAVIGSKKGAEIISQSISKMQPAKPKPQEENPYAYNEKDRKRARVPKILDTSVIIDGRIFRGHEDRISRGSYSDSGVRFGRIETHSRFVGLSKENERTKGA